MSVPWFCSLYSSTRRYYLHRMQLGFLVKTYYNSISNSYGNIASYHLHLFLQLDGWAVELHEQGAEFTTLT
jgi:hypothetical protein